MKKFLVAFAILMASFSTANAGSDKNIVICYFEGNKVVFENVSRVNYYDVGMTRVRLKNGAEIDFSGAYICLEVENNDNVVDDIKKRFGNKLE